MFLFFFKKGGFELFKSYLMGSMDYVLDVQSPAPVLCILPEMVSVENTVAN